jgi:hypothetical protein
MEGGAAQPSRGAAELRARMALSVANLGPTCTGNTANDNFLDVSSWWMVDLGAVMEIAYVVVFGRSDCCSDQSQTLRVAVGVSSDALSNPVCADTVAGVFGDATQGTKVCAAGAAGRFVVLSALRGRYSFCELQVFQQT